MLTSRGSNPTLIILLRTSVSKLRFSSRRRVMFSKSSLSHGTNLYNFSTMPASFCSIKVTQSAEDLQLYTHCILAYECMSYVLCFAIPSRKTVLTQSSTFVSRFTHIQCKGKVSPYSLPSVGPGDDPGVQAVSKQLTLKSFPSGRLPLLSARPASLPCKHSPDGASHLSAAHCSFIDPERIKGCCCFWKNL